MSARRTAQVVLVVGLLLSVAGLATALLSLREVQSPGGVLTSVSSGLAALGLAVLALGINLTVRDRRRTGGDAQPSGRG